MSSNQRYGQKIKREEAIIVTNEVNSLNEEYNKLKDSLLYMCSEKIKVIQVESTRPGEGKTTLASNLAVSLGYNNKKVLVIDLDFRKPRVHRLFGVSNQNGIVDYISNKIDRASLIKKTKYENVNIISRGSDLFNPSMLLTSDRFKKLISDLREEYDFILLDSPPVLQISDYIHISRVSDGILFVVAYGQTKRNQVAEAANLLRNDNINVIGTVMTFVDAKDPYSAYYGSYYGKYYGHYAKDSGDLVDGNKSSK